MSQERIEHIVRALAASLRTALLGCGIESDGMELEFKNQMNWIVGIHDYPRPMNAHTVEEYALRQLTLRLVTKVARSTFSKWREQNKLLLAELVLAT